MKYLPFGETLTGSVPTDKKFTGQRLDDTGLYYYGARYYDSLIGRFISPDTAGSALSTPQSFNKYAYCFNNPLKYNDPTGHWPDWGAIWNGVCSAAYAVKSFVTSNIDSIQTSLNFIGMIPGVGVIADLANAGISAARGDWSGAGMSLASAVPVVGDALGAGKLIAKGADTIIGFAKDIVKGADKIEDASKAGWKVGDSITALTKAGNEPSWNTVRQRYWKNEALNNADAYSGQNLNRIKQGLAPLDATGTSMQLHHINGRMIPNPHNIYNLQPVTLWQHQQIHYVAWPR